MLFTHSYKLSHDFCGKFVHLFIISISSYKSCAHLFHSSIPSILDSHSSYFIIIRDISSITSSYISFPNSVSYKSTSWLILYFSICSLSHLNGYGKAWIKLYIFNIFSSNSSSFPPNNSSILYNPKLLFSSLYDSYAFSNKSSNTFVFIKILCDSSHILMFGSISNILKFSFTSLKQKASIVVMLALFIYISWFFKWFTFCGSFSCSKALYIAFSIFSLSSWAAAFVKVTTNILSTSKYSSKTFFIILSTSTAVLPLPADALTNIFESLFLIAFSWSSVQLLPAILFLLFYIFYILFYYFARINLDYILANFYLN